MVQFGFKVQKSERLLIREAWEQADAYRPGKPNWFTKKQKDLVALHGALLPTFDLATLPPPTQQRLGARRQIKGPNKRGREPALHDDHSHASLVHVAAHRDRDGDREIKVELHLSVFKILRSPKRLRIRALQCSE